MLMEDYEYKQQLLFPLPLLQFASNIWFKTKNRVPPAPLWLNFEWEVHSPNISLGLMIQTVKTGWDVAHILDS